MDFRCHRPSTRRTPFGRRRSRTPSPVHIQAPFGQHHPSERQRTTAEAMAAATATPPSPPAAAMRQPSDTCPSAADTRPDWPPGSRPRKWSTTEGPVSAIGDQVPVSVARRHLSARRATELQLLDTARERRQDTTVHHMAQLGQLGFYFRAADGQSADRSGSLQPPCSSSAAGPAGGRLRRPSSAGTTRPEPGNRSRPSSRGRAAAAPASHVLSPPEQVHAMPSQHSRPYAPLG